VPRPWLLGDYRKYAKTARNRKPKKIGRRGNIITGCSQKKHSSGVMPTLEATTGYVKKKKKKNSHKGDRT